MEKNEDFVAALTWVLKDAQQLELDVLDEPIDFYVGGGDLLPAIDQSLRDHDAQNASYPLRVELALEPADAFGDPDEKRVLWADRKVFPEGIEEGMIIEGHALPPEVLRDAPASAFYIISEIYPEHVVLDGNHPLAGMGLRLQLTVHGTRAPTDQERQDKSCGMGFFKLEATDEKMGDDPHGHPPTLH